jgi:hypothetical protein
VGHAGPRYRPFLGVDRYGGFARFRPVGSNPYPATRESSVFDSRGLWPFDIAIYHLLTLSHSKPFGRWPVVSSGCSRPEFGNEAGFRPLLWGRRGPPHRFAFRRAGVPSQGTGGVHVPARSRVDTASNTRLYGAAIAVAPGGYALWSVSGVSGMDATAWAMALVGVVANLHGVALDRLRSPDPGEWPPHGRLSVRDVAQAVMGRGMRSTDRAMGLDGSMMAGGMVGRRHGRARAVDARERARHESGESVDDAGR